MSLIWLHVKHDETLPSNKIFSYSSFKEHWNSNSLDPQIFCNLGTFASCCFKHANDQIFLWPMHRTWTEIPLANSYYFLHKTYCIPNRAYRKNHNVFYRLLLLRSMSMHYWSFLLFLWLTHRKCFFFVLWNCFDERRDQNIHPSRKCLEQRKEL